MEIITDTRKRVHVLSETWEVSRGSSVSFARDKLFAGSTFHLPCLLHHDLSSFSPVIFDSHPVQCECSGSCRVSVLVSPFSTRNTLTYL
jgi:hypothetical protein